MEGYAAEIEGKRQRFFGWLSEKDRRRDAAVEAAKLGQGGVESIARVLACDPKTIRPGLHEREEAEDAAAGRLRTKGGGRAPRAVAQPTLEAHLRRLVQACTAGDPMRAGVLGTNLSRRELSRRLVALGTPAGRRTIRRLLRTRTRGRRTARKQKTMGHHPERNAPLENMARLRREYEAAGDAVLAIETHKQEGLGHFHRAGTPCTTETVETFDHDFGSAGQGQLIPHGSDAMGNHHAPIHLKTSHATSAWCGDSVALWWEDAGRPVSPQAPRLWRLGDGGGSNSAPPSLCKEDGQGLAHRLGLERRVAHDPPDCSPSHPIAHQVFPQITRACQGGIFHTVDIAQPFIARAKTTTGRRVTVRMLDKVYQTGRTYAADCTHNMPILFDDHLPKWNYRAVPAGT